MKPSREHATNNAKTYMITSSTWGCRALFRNERWARLLIDTLYRYRRFCVPLTRIRDHA